MRVTSKGHLTIPEDIREELLTRDAARYRARLPQLPLIAP